MDPVFTHWGEKLRNLRKELQDLLMSQEDQQEKERTEIEKQIEVIESLFQNQIQNLENESREIRRRITFIKITIPTYMNGNVLVVHDETRLSQEKQNELYRLRMERNKIERQMIEIRKVLKS